MISSCLIVVEIVVGVKGPGHKSQQIIGVVVRESLTIYVWGCDRVICEVILKCSVCVRPQVNT